MVWGSAGINQYPQKAGWSEEPDPPAIISWSEPGHTAVQQAHG